VTLCYAQSKPGSATMEAKLNFAPSTQRKPKEALASCVSVSNSSETQKKKPPRVCRRAPRGMFARAGAWACTAWSVYGRHAGRRGKATPSNKGSTVVTYPVLNRRAPAAASPVPPRRSTSPPGPPRSRSTANGITPSRWAIGLMKKVFSSAPAWPATRALCGRRPRESRLIY